MLMMTPCYRQKDIFVNCNEPSITMKLIFLKAYEGKPIFHSLCTQNYYIKGNSTRRHEILPLKGNLQLFRSYCNRGNTK